MDKKATDEFAEQLLDGTLRRLASEEPAPGLDGRVLARLQARKNFLPGSFWEWRLAAGAALLAILVLAIFWPAHTPPRDVAKPNRENLRSAMAAPQPSVSISKPLTKASVSRQMPQHFVRQRGKVQALREPRLAMFPSPAPLSQQEKLLLQYVKAVPPSNLLANQSSDGSLRAITITKLEILPLDIDSREAKTENRQ